MTKPEDEDAASGKSAPGTPPTGSLPEATADETEVAPPKVQAPPLSPAIEPICAPAASDTAATDAAIAPAKQPGRGGDSLSSRAALRRRLKQHRRLLHAASLLVAAGLGGLIGAFAADRWAGPRSDIPAIEESRKLQRSVAQLGKEMAALKADLERATRRVPDQAAKPQTSDHAARLDRTEQDVTGTIPPKQATVEPLPQTAPLPPPRPRTVVSSGKPPVLRDWWIRDARGGYVFVEGHGDVYQVVPGAPLPGLGPVEAIKRENGAWVVVTPEGLIVADRDRSRFE